MFDDNLTTYWHSNYSNDNRQSGHFFILDRGADFANTTVDGFGYLPRQSTAGNGFVNKFRVYVLPESDKEAIEAIPSVGLGQNNQTADGSHEALDSFLANKTAVATDHPCTDEGAPTNQGIMSYDPTTWSTENRLLQQVKFTQPQTGRYVVFVIDSSAGAGSGCYTPNNNANCAEFYLYDWLDTSGDNTKEIDIELLRFRTDLDNRTLYTGKRTVVVGQTVPAYGFATCDHQGRIDAETTKLTYTINETEEVYIVSAQGANITYGQPGNRKYIGTTTYNNAPSFNTSSTAKALLMIKSRINENVVYICDPEGDYKGMFGGKISNAAGIPLTEYPREAQPYLLVRNDDTTYAIRNANRRTQTSDYMNYYGNQQPNIGGWQQAQDQQRAGSHWFIVPVSNLDQFENNLQYFNGNSWKGGSLFTAIASAEEQLELNANEALSNAVAAAKAADFGRDNISELITEMRNNMDMTEVARTTFQNYTGTRYNNHESFGSLFAVPGWSSTSDAKALNLYNAIKDNDNTAMVAAIDAIGTTTGAVTNQKNGAEFTEGVLYRILSTDADARGYLCVTADGVLSNTTNSDAANLPDINNSDDAANFLFGFVAVDGKNYMYSAKTGTLLNAFAQKNDIEAHAQYHDFTWQLTDADNSVVPTALTFVVYRSAVAHSLVLNGGVRGNAGGGISLVNAGGRPLVAPGLANGVDGNGLQFSFGGFASNYGINLDNVKSAVRTAIEAANAAVEALPGEDVEAKIVNGLTDEAISAIVAATLPDHKQHLLANGARNEVAEGTVYTLKNVSTGKYFAIVDGAQGEADEITDTHTNWLCEAGDNEGNYKFAHTVNTAEAARAANKVYLTIGDATEHTVTPGEYGQVLIGGTPYVMATGSGDAETTGIREITAAGENGSTVVYDLQGRRVAKTAKGGLYIVNGVKTLVK